MPPVCTPHNSFKLGNILKEIATNTHNSRLIYKPYQVGARNDLKREVRSAIECAGTKSLQEPFVATKGFHRWLWPHALSNRAIVYSVGP